MITTATCDSSQCPRSYNMGCRRSVDFVACFRSVRISYIGSFALFYNFVFQKLNKWFGGGALGYWTEGDDVTLVFPSGSNLSSLSKLLFIVHVNIQYIYSIVKPCNLVL